MCYGQLARTIYLNIIMGQVEKVTISLPRNVIAFADELANERKISRSKVISACLRDFAEQRRLAELEEGYRAMAEENRKFAKMAFELQRKVVTDQK